MAKSAQPGALMRRQKVVNEITSTAAQVFNWGVDDQRPTIRIGVINMATLKPLPEPAIEVEVAALALPPAEPPPSTAA
jgi:hypothetical protein